MKNIIVINASPDFFKKLNNFFYCSKGIQIYPETEKDLNIFISQVRSALDIGMDPAIQKDATEKVKMKLEKLPSSNTVFIINYQLVEGKNRISGMQFVAKFLENSSNKFYEAKKIMVSETHSDREIESMERFVDGKKNFHFINKKEAQFLMKLLDLM